MEDIFDEEFVEKKFRRYAEKKGKANWSLHVGSAKKAIDSDYSNPNVDNAWQEVVEQVHYQLSQGVTYIVIKVKSNAKDSGPHEIQIGKKGRAGAARVGGAMYMNGVGGNSTMWEKIIELQLTNQGLQSSIMIDEMNRKHEAALGQLHQKIEEKMSFWEHPAIAPVVAKVGLAVGGKVVKAIDKFGSDPKPNLKKQEESKIIHLSSKAKLGRIEQEQQEETIQEVAEELDQEGEDVELTDDQNAGLDGMELLAETGEDKPGELFFNIARFAKDKPKEYSTLKTLIESQLIQ